MNKLQLVCIFVEENAVLPLTLYNIYWGEPTDRFPDYYVIYFNENDVTPCSWQVYPKEEFLTMAEWREQQINSILDD